MKVTTAWTFYDWANSAFALVITAAIFPSYFLRSTDEILYFGDVAISNSSLYAYIIALAYAIVTVASPLLSGFSDSANNKKVMLFLFCLVGSLSCMGLYFFDGMQHLLLGCVFFIFGLIGFQGSLVFYNAYLPEITTEDKFDRVSANGFSMGYFGSVILLIVNLMMISNPEWFHLPDAKIAVRISFFMVGLWWLLFSLIPLSYLPGSMKLSINTDNITKGIWILKDVWYKLKKLHDVRRFLFAFFAYSAGVQTVMLLAAAFAQKQMNFATSELIILILLIQLVAIIGAYLFSMLSRLRGNKFSIMTMLFIWLFICIIGYIVQTKIQFYILAGVVGMVMGGIQSLSRSTYSKLIYRYKGEHTSFFSFYDVLEKLSVIIGTFSFGFIEQITGGMRNSIFALGIFFVLGIILLNRTKLDFKSKLLPVIDEL